MFQRPSRTSYAIQPAAQSERNGSGRRRSLGLSISRPCRSTWRFHVILGHQAQPLSSLGGEGAA